MRDAAGHDRMYLAKGWIAVDPGDMTITISDGDGYTLPQTVECKSMQEIDDVVSYIATGENPCPGLSHAENEELEELLREQEDDEGGLGIEVSSEDVAIREGRQSRIKYLEEKKSKGE